MTPQEMSKILTEMQKSNPEGFAEFCTKAGGGYSNPNDYVGQLISRPDVMERVSCLHLNVPTEQERRDQLLRDQVDAAKRAADAADQANTRADAAEKSSRWNFRLTIVATIAAVGSMIAAFWKP